MQRIALRIALVATAFTYLFPGTDATAQSTRVFVSGQGNDGKPCTFNQPCRTFQRAHDVVAANGEIAALDAADFGKIIINKAVSIQGNGIAGISGAGGGTAITINAGGGQVNLRGLIIDGAVSGVDGIRFNSGASLNIQHSSIRNFKTVSGDCGGCGIVFVPGSSTNLFISDTIIADNNNMGIFIVPTGSGTINADFERLLIENNPNVGINIGVNFGTVSATFSNGLIARNGGGVGVGIAPGAQASLLISNSTVSNNINYGLAVGSAIIRMTKTRVTGSGVTAFLSSGGGIIASYGDNNIDGNAGNETPTTTISMK